MHGNGRTRSWVRLAAPLLFAGCLAAVPARADDPPRPSQPAAAPTTGVLDRAGHVGAGEVNVFLKAPADLDALWKALARPDFVILKGEEYTRLRDGLRAQAGRPEGWSAVVESVSVSGSVRGDRANLTVELGVSVASEGPVWVPVRLDGLTLARAREGDRDLAVRTASGGGREVELSGKGKHTVRVEVLAPVLMTPEGKRLEMAVPEAPATRFSFEVPARVASASSSTAEPVVVTPLRDGATARLSADLSPRQRLALVWRVEEEAGAPLPPLLMAQGEIAIDVEPGSFRTRSFWSIRSVRGTARSLQVRFDRADEVLELELDGQSPPAGTDEENGAPRMTIPLTDPLGPGEERKLVMSTRRSIDPRGAARISFSGFPLNGVREQTGAIGITQGSGLWINGTAGRGVRQIDPRTELPTELRARPGTALAYQFSGQPFALELQIEPSPPQVRPEARTTVSLEPGLARVDTWLDYQTARGRLYELTLGVPPGFEIESVGPDEVVGAWQISGLALATSAAADPAGLRILTARLLPKVQDGGQFSLHVVGRQGLEPGRDVKVGLLRPLGVVSGGGRIAVLTDPSMTADLSEPAEGWLVGGVFRPAAQAPPADWPWPAGRAPAAPPMLWLRYVQSPGELPLRVAAHPRSISHATDLQVRVGRRGVDVQQETEYTIRHGSIDHLDVDVPPRIEGRWQLDGGATASDLGPNDHGGRTHRLSFASEVARGVRLRYRYNLPMRPLEPGKPTDMRVDWIRPVGSEASPGMLHATISAEPGLGLSVPSEAWQVVADPPAPTGEAEGSAERLARVAPEAEVKVLDLRVSARAQVALPSVVVPRMVLRTFETPGRELRTTAWLGVETQDPALAFGLPAGAVLQRVRVGGEIVSQIEQLPEGAGYRVALPSRTAPSGPLLVELDYVVPSARAQGAWEPVRLAEGGLVQQTYWEVRVPWSRALVGVPSGWSDENRWYWDLYVWKRRPWHQISDLVTGNAETTSGLAVPGAELARGDDHGYLFSRPGPPAALPALVVSRAMLIGVGSGSVLALAMLFTLVWRPPALVSWGAGLGLLLAAAVLFHPSVTFLSVQSSMVGLALAGTLAMMQRLVERRRRAAATFAAASASTSSHRSGSSLARADLVGSDDSTAIRSRPVQVSTLDFVPPGTSAAPQPAPSISAHDGPSTSAGSTTRTASRLEDPAREGVAP